MKPAVYCFARCLLRCVAHPAATRLAALAVVGCIAATTAFDADARQQFRLKKLAGLGGAVAINNAGVVADVDQSAIDDLVVGFDGPLGLWQWKNGSTWVGLHGVSPQRIIATDFDGQ